MPEKIDPIKENSIFKKIKHIIYSRIKKRKMNVKVYEIGNQINFDKIKL